MSSTKKTRKKKRKKTCAEYIDCIKSGEPQKTRCINEMYERYFGFVKHFARKFKKLSYNDTFSIYNEAVAELIYRIETGAFIAESEYACSTFIYQTAKNLCISLNKKDGRYIDIVRRIDEEGNEIKIEPPDLDELSEISGHFDQGEWQGLWEREELSICFQKLSAKCQEILMLWSMSFSMKEIVAMVEKVPNPNNAGVVKHDCLKKLKRYIGKYLDDRKQ